MDENKIILQVCEFTGQYEYTETNNVVLWILVDGSTVQIDFNQMETTMTNWIVYDKTFYSIVGLSITSGIVVTF